MLDGRWRRWKRTSEQLSSRRGYYHVDWAAIQILYSVRLYLLEPLCVGTALLDQGCHTAVELPISSR